MSLPNAPFGFRAIRALHGGELRMGRYTVSSASSRIFKGDAVALQNSTGLVIKQLNSGTERILGVANRDTGVLSGQVTDFPVYDDPNIVYEVQCNNTGAITQAKFGNPYRIRATAGNTTLGHSKEVVLIGSSAASVSYCVFALRLSPKQENDLSQYSVIEVLLAGDPTKIARA